ncbi:hypothetical protein ABTD92_22035, partial [Acinetobacter baumannii]
MADVTASLRFITVFGCCAFAANDEARNRRINEGKCLAADIFFAFGFILSNQVYNTGKTTNV